MRILAIETSCDETGIALVEASGPASKPKFKILKETLASQIEVHRPWGGVVPNLAKREHIKNLPILLEEISDPGSGIRNKADMIAVTVAPGLEPALWTGIEFAKELAKKWRKPLIGVNHMEGHLFSPLLDSGLRISDSKKLFPAVALIVSGGHTILLRMDSMAKWKKLGETRDDAAGEAFDKVARLLKLPYPGGPEISRIALAGNPKVITFPQPMLNSKNYDFSFSGLKTAVLYYLKQNPDAKTASVAAGFEFAAVNVLVQKTMRAVRESGARSVWLAGGVAANRLLRKTLTRETKNLGILLLVPDQKHNTDNAAMIGAAAYMQILRKKKLPLKANSELSIM